MMLSERKLICIAPHLDDLHMGLQQHVHNLRLVARSLNSTPHRFPSRHHRPHSRLRSRASCCSFL